MHNPEKASGKCITARKRDFGRQNRGNRVMILIIRPSGEKYEVVSWSMERIDTTTREGKSHLDNFYEEVVFDGTIEQCQIHADHMVKADMVNRGNLIDAARDEMNNAMRLISRI